MAEITIPAGNLTQAAAYTSVKAKAGLTPHNPTLGTAASNHITTNVSPTAFEIQNDEVVTVPQFTNNCTANAFTVDAVCAYFRLILNAGTVTSGSPITIDFGEDNIQLNIDGMKSADLIFERDFENPEHWYLWEVHAEDSMRLVSNIRFASRAPNVDRFGVPIVGNAVQQG
jgi:hypothetical protein